MNDILRSTETDIGMAIQNKSCTMADLVVGRNLRAIRCHRRISAEDAAGRLDCPIDTYEAVEAGRLRLCAEALYDLANFLQCRISDFFAMRPGEDRPPVPLERGSAIRGTAP